MTLTVSKPVQVRTQPRLRQSTLPREQLHLDKPLRKAKAQPATEQSSQKQNQLGNLEKALYRSAVDAFVLRAPLRIAEKLLTEKLADNPFTSFLRTGFRLGSEAVRKNAEGLFVNSLNGKKGLSLGDFKTNTLRAMEHWSTLVLEPGLFKGPVAKILAGFGNNSIRQGTRAIFYRAGLIDRAELGAKRMVDEAISRSVPRVICTDSSDPLKYGLTKGIEQFIINMNLHAGKPYERLLPDLSKTMEKIFHMAA